MSLEALRGGPISTCEARLSNARGLIFQAYGDAGWRKLPKPRLLRRRRSSGTPCQHPERTGKHGRQQDYSRQFKDYQRYPKSSQLLPGPQMQSILRLKSRQGLRMPVARPFGRRCSHFELQLTPALNVGMDIHPTTAVNVTLGFRARYSAFTPSTMGLPSQYTGRRTIPATQMD